MRICGWKTLAIFGEIDSLLSDKNYEMENVRNFQNTDVENLEKL